MSPGTPPDAHPEHVKAPSAASEPLAGAPYPKTSIFLKEIIDFRCRVGPSRPRISGLFETLGMLFFCSKSFAQVTFNIPNVEKTDIAVLAQSSVLFVRHHLASHTP